jgi:hypothetical protein
MDTDDLQWRIEAAEHVRRLNRERARKEKLEELREEFFSLHNKALGDIDESPLFQEFTETETNKGNIDQQTLNEALDTAKLELKNAKTPSKVEAIEEVIRILEEVGAIHSNVVDINGKKYYDATGAVLSDPSQEPLEGRGRKSRKSRLNVKRRGTKRHRRSGKHRKLRKLSTRRR